MLRYLIPAGLVAILAAGAVVATPKASPTTKPADAPTTQPAPVKATVKSVLGIAEALDLSVENSKWKRIKVGDVLSEDSIIRTWLGANVVLQFDGRDDVTIKSATKVGISSFGKRGKTQLGLKYGAIDTKGDGPHGGKRVKTRYGLTYNQALKTVAAMSGDNTRGVRFGCLSVRYSSGCGLSYWADSFEKTGCAWAVKIWKGSSSKSLGYWSDRGKANILCELLSEFGEEAGVPYVEAVKRDIIER